MEKINLTDRKLRELYYDNYTYKQISGLYDCSIAHVCRKVNRLIKDGYMNKRPNVKKLVFENLKDIKDIDNQNRKRTTYNDIVSLYKKGVSVRDIAKLLGYSTDTIHKSIQKYKQSNSLDIQSKKSLDRNYIIELYNGELKYTQISQLLNISLHSIFRIVNESILNNTIIDRKDNMLTKKDIRIIEMYRNGMSIEYIARSFGNSIKTIEKRVLQFTNKGLLIEEHMMKNNFIVNRKLIYNAYINGISCSTIAWYLKISENVVKKYIDENSLVAKNNIIDTMIYDYRPKDISKILNIPVQLIYLHLREVL